MCAAKVHCCKEPKYCSCFIIFNPCVCVCACVCVYRVSYSTNAFLLTVLWFVSPVTCTVLEGGAATTQWDKNGWITDGKCSSSTRVYLREAAVFLERGFFFSSSRLLRNRGPSFRYAVQLIQWKMRCFFNPTFNILPPLCTHTISLPLSLLLCVCSCCMPASVFISGSSQHGRHVLCYC